MWWLRRTTVFLLVLVGLVAVPPARAADLYSATASARGSALPRLAAAASVAQSSASAQASAGSLFHTNLSGLLGTCSSVAETVGRGPDVSSIFEAFRNSGSHWSIITSSKWTSMGAGSATGANGLLYVSLVFCQGAGGDPAPASSSGDAGTGTQGAAGTRAGTGRASTGAPAPPIVHHPRPELLRGRLLADQAVGLFDEATASWSLTDGDGVETFFFGTAGDVPLACDWNGNGVDTVGVYRPSEQTFHLKMRNQPGEADLLIRYGEPEDIPICGDWEGDGVDTIAVYRPSQGSFHLRKSNSPGPADLTFTLDAPEGVPLVGDWNGNGVDTVGIHDRTTGRVLIVIGDGSMFEGHFGNPGDRLVAGDWDGDEMDTLGVFRPSEATFYLSDRLKGTADAERVITFGDPERSPVSGWWHPPLRPDMLALVPE